MDVDAKIKHAVETIFPVGAPSTIRSHWKNSALIIQSSITDGLVHLKLGKFFYVDRELPEILELEFPSEWLDLEKSELLKKFSTSDSYRCL